MYTKLLDKQTKLALIGLGYVGLPIAIEFAKHVSVIGFDINEDRLDKLRNGIDPCGELSSEVFEHKDITFTSSIEKLREASFYVIAVPTPIDSHNEPDLPPLRRLCSIRIYRISGMYGRGLHPDLGGGFRVESRRGL